MRSVLPILAAALALAPPALGQFAGSVTKQWKITEGQSGFTQDLMGPDLFGVAIASAGDLDGDGAQDLLVGAYTDSEFVPYAGALYVLFLKPDGTVKSYRKIGSNQAGFNVTLDPLDMFGWSIANLGDLDGDGSPEIAVGSWLDDDGGTNDQGAIYVLFLKPDGSVKKHHKITEGVGGFTWALYDGTRFGTSLTNLGDLNGDGVVDLLAGAIYDNDAAYLAGSCYVLFLKADGTVRSSVKITQGQGGFWGQLAHQHRFGYASANLGDLDGDGVTDVAVSSFLDDDGGEPHGAVWILFLQPDGWVKSWSKISATEGGLLQPLDPVDCFGSSLAALPDLNGDGVPELAVGALGDDDGGDLRGCVYVLSLQRDGTSFGQTKISSTAGGFAGMLHDEDRFGQAAAFLGDLDGDGSIELGIGADHDDDGGPDAGAVWIASLAQSPFTWLGHGSIAPAPVPSLAMTGTLEPLSPVGLHLGGAPPQAPGLLLLSVQPSPQAFAGTVLLPNSAPPAVLQPFATDAAGELNAVSTWPAGVPPAFRLYVQALVADPAGWFGITASNALMATAP